jgi:Cytochrome P450
MSLIGVAEIVAALLAAYMVYKYFTRDPRRASLPPHVRGWPIINQTFDQMQDNVIPVVQGWAKEYGEVFRTTSGTTTFIWLNSRKSVKELIDRRSAIYSSRHPQPMVERASGFKRMVFMPYGKDWRSLRNIVHRVRIYNWMY